MRLPEMEDPARFQTRAHWWRKMTGAERRAVKLAMAVFGPGTRLVGHWRYRKVKPVSRPPEDWSRPVVFGVDEEV